jgi:predicted nucleic acid-binding Zn ribbon protein
MFHSLKNLLPKSLERSKIGRQVEISMVLEEFSRAVEKILGEKSARRIKPLYLKNRVITVATLSSVLAQELKLNEDKIIKKINEKFGREIILKIRYLI